MNTVRVLLLRIIADQGSPTGSAWVCARYWRSDGPWKFRNCSATSCVGLETGNPHLGATPLPIAFVSGFQAGVPGMKGPG